MGMLIFQRRKEIALSIAPGCIFLNKPPAIHLVVPKKAPLSLSSTPYAKVEPDGLPHFAF